MLRKFSELFTWSSGKPVIAREGNVPIYGSNGIIGYTNQAKYRNKIILGRVGAYCGSVAYCAGDFTATDNTLITTCNEDKIIYSYAFYLLKQYKLNDFAGGSAQPLITQGLLKHLKCDIPDNCAQERIASILSAYDDLIENNNQRIKILEQMAENLYKEWFVRFRFPGHEKTTLVSSRLGKIPNTFSVIEIHKCVDYDIGGGWGMDEECKDYPIESLVIRGTDFPYVRRGILSTCPKRYHKGSNYKSRELKDGDVIIEVSGGTEEQPVGRALLITDNVLKRAGDKLICASFCKLLRLNNDKISPTFFSYWMDYLYKTRMIDKFQVQSTGIINLKYKYFMKKGEVLLPPRQLMLLFTKEARRIQSQIDKLSETNDNIIKQRDMLLPRLMSGKLKV